MKLKVLFPLVTAGVMASSSGSAQVVESFDNILDNVLQADNVANFFAGALNTNSVAADIDISVNVSALNSTSASTSLGSTTNDAFFDLTNTFTDVSASGTSSTAGGNVFDIGSADLNISGTFTDVSGSAAFADLTSSVWSSTGSFTSETSQSLSEVVSSFGDLSTVAAGAVNDVEITITQTGDTATVEADYAASTVGEGITSTNLTGGKIGLVMSAVNNAPIDGSVSMSFINAAGAATSISTTAVGSLNAGSLTATFVGGNEADAVVNLPE